MSLRDEHLAKALKHAPDSDLAPSEAVRKNVLQHASKISQSPHKNWFAALLSPMKNWQLAGMSSVAVALLAVLLLREQLPPEMTQPKDMQAEATPKVLAQNTVPSPEKTLKQERLDAAEYSAAEPALEPPKAVARVQDQAKAETLANASVMADSGNVVAAAPTVAAPATQSVSPPPAPVAQELAKQDNSAGAESNDRLEAAPAEVVVASAEEKNKAEKPKAVAKKSMMLVDADALGVAKANRDIQASVLRILVAEWPADKALLDEATGYRVEVVKDLVPEELAAYNQTMRDWHKSQH